MGVRDMTENETLPYSFDLHLDIKTKARLRERIKYLESEIELIRELIAAHNVKLD